MLSFLVCKIHLIDNILSVLLQLVFSHFICSIPMTNMTKKLFDLNVVVCFWLLEPGHWFLENIVAESINRRLFHRNPTSLHDFIVTINNLIELMLKLGDVLVIPFSNSFSCLSLFTCLSSHSLSGLSPFSSLFQFFWVWWVKILNFMIFVHLTNFLLHFCVSLYNISCHSKCCNWFILPKIFFHILNLLLLVDLPIVLHFFTTKLLQIIAITHFEMVEVLHYNYSNFLVLQEELYCVFVLQVCNWLILSLNELGMRCMELNVAQNFIPVWLFLNVITHLKECIISLS